MSNSVSLQNYTNISENDLKEQDPMQLLPRVMLKLTVNESDLLRVLANNVLDLQSQIEDLTNKMQIANTGQAFLSGQDPSTPYYFYYSQAVGSDPNDPNSVKAAQLADANAQIAAWEAAGAGKGLILAVYTTDPTTHKATYALAMYKGTQSVDTIVKNLQNQVNTLTTQNQQAQLDLQTLLGRISAGNDMVSAVIKRNGDMLQTITNNFKVI